jgi:hypothetical protein
MYKINNTDGISHVVLYTPIIWYHCVGKGWSGLNGLQAMPPRVVKISTARLFTIFLMLVKSCWSLFGVCLQIWNDIFLFFWGGLTWWRCPHISNPCKDILKKIVKVLLLKAVAFDGIQKCSHEIAILFIQFLSSLSPSRLSRERTANGSRGYWNCCRQSSSFNAKVWPCGISLF